MYMHLIYLLNIYKILLAGYLQNGIYQYVFAEMTKPCFSKKWNVQESIKTVIAVNTRLQVV